MEKLLARSREVCVDMATEDLCEDHSIIIRFLSFSGLLYNLFALTIYISLKKRGKLFIQEVALKR